MSPGSKRYLVASFGDSSMYFRSVKSQPSACKLFIRIIGSPVTSEVANSEMPYCAS